jgi:tRNA threonylcarbamoyladenosine biosynthesis protein TsaE
MKVTTISPEETEKLGEEFAKKLKPQDVVFLIGNLGSGKTTFTKGIARGLGITTRILSPTFVVVRSHSTQKGAIQTLYHLDLYRLKNEGEVLNTNLTDYINDEKGIVVIEWPEVSQDIVRKKAWNITFEVKEDRHMIEIVENR